jgi:hypothetical protein
LPISIEIEDNFTLWNAEPSMNQTFRGITIDWSEEDENISDSIRVKCEFDSNVIDESEVQFEKQCEPTISISAPIPTFDDCEKLWISL